MELVDGPTLADRITRGPVPINEALPIAREIVAALEYAHERGIVHRDLKPANIKLTADGRVKLLDFGLAKAVQEELPAANPASSPTLTMRATMAGVIMGTAAYMSPEQARGQAVDKRADIWSFGVVLYELLTGRPLFLRDTMSDTLAAVLTTVPDWSALPPSTPASIGRLLRRCLERDRERRMPDIGVARLEIDDAGEPSERVSAPPGKFSRALWAITVVALFTAIAAIVFAWRALIPVERTLRPASPRASRRARIATAGRSRPRPGSRPPPAPAPPAPSVARRSASALRPKRLRARSSGTDLRSARELGSRTLQNDR